MKSFAICLAAVLLGAVVAFGQQPGLAPARGVAEDAVEVLTRGPVHEAFAGTISFDPEPGVVVANAPPEAIEELPPEQKPEGAHVDWIPGYWAWDDERDDFLWISGVWRSLPPGRQWVPGYWNQAGRGFQWTSGYWADARATEVEYLPEPPQTVEAGPNVEAPSADHTWLPGSWVWQQNRYAWRPGYWATAQPNWIWVPAHYVWTPRGYVFVDGYHDYSVARRGVLFAPVYFRSNVYAQRGFAYSPVTVINPAVFTSHLFLRPSYGHYYFGDYYAANYLAGGFSPWFSFYSSRSGYDPFYAHQRWHHRNDRGWDRRVQEEFAHRRDHEEARPPRTWTAQRDRSNRRTTTSDHDRGFVVASSLDELAKSKDTPIRLQPVASQEREQIGQRWQQVRQARAERQKLEAEAAAPTAEAPVPSADSPRRAVEPYRGRLPKTPIASQPVERFAPSDTPPPALEAPQPDPRIEPRPRVSRGKAQSPPATQVTPREARSQRPEVRRSQPQPKASDAQPQPRPEPATPKAQPRPETPQVAPRATPQPAPPATPQGGTRVRPKGGSKGGGKGNPQN